MKRVIVAVAFTLLSIPAEAQDDAASEAKGAAETPARSRNVKRAPRPRFEGDDWQGIFFQNLFAEGLRGDRPRSRDTAPRVVDGASISAEPEGASKTNSPDSWSSVIPASVLEDEIKRQHIRLGNLVTNPGQFQTRNAEIGETMTTLATMFAIISAYDGQVRWRNEAVSAVAALTSATARARTTDNAAFESVRGASGRLADLVRGGSFGPEPGASPVSDWSEVADRSAVMDRLEQNTERTIKAFLGDNKAFGKDAESVAHEAAIIAALGRVLQQPEMPDAEDEDFRALAEEMVNAATSLRDAAGRNLFDDARASLNRINQSCVNCHADWR